MSYTLNSPRRPLNISPHSTSNRNTLCHPNYSLSISHSPNRILQLTYLNLWMPHTYLLLLASTPHLGPRDKDRDRDRDRGICPQKRRILPINTLVILPMLPSTHNIPSWHRHLSLSLPPRVKYQIISSTIRTIIRTFHLHTAPTRTHQCSIHFNRIPHHSLTVTCINLCRPSHSIMPYTIPTLISTPSTHLRLQQGRVWVYRGLGSDCSPMHGLFL
jgi:hypothetical protein